jgi:hypothetical protein
MNGRCSGGALSIRGSADFGASVSSRTSIGVKDRIDVVASMQSLCPRRSAMSAQSLQTSMGDDVGQEAEAAVECSDLIPQSSPLSNKKNCPQTSRMCKNSRHQPGCLHRAPGASSSDAERQDNEGYTLHKKEHAEHKWHRQRRCDRRAKQQ